MNRQVPSVKALKIREEIENGRYEPAIILSNIVKGTAPDFLRDPAKFFERTHVTEPMKRLVIQTLMGLLGKTQVNIGGKTYRMHNKLMVLPSLFGGGKSHSLAVLYHILNIVRNTESKEKAREIISKLDKDIAGFIYENWSTLKSIGVKVVVVDCGSRDFAPVPEDNREVKTLWGYIAQQLGRYSEIAQYDGDIAPPKEALKEVLNNSGGVVLIDEIARYYTRTKQLDRNVIDTFLMNLTEVLTTEEIGKSVVIITLPYDVERGIIEEAHANVIRAENIKKIIDRVGVGNTISVVASSDLPSILRRRIFEESEETLREYGRIIAEKLYENASPIAREYIDKKGGKDELREELEKTYPFHPETINVLRLLHEHLSKYLQATRNPIRLASEAILSIRKGLYDWLGFTPYLIMPFHIPVIREEVLAEAFPLTFSEFTVFRNILEKDVVHPIKSENEKVILGDNIVEKIPKDYHIPSFMITTYIWLRSLAGGGLVSNIEVYPTIDDIARSLMDLETVGNKEWMDVSKILKTLHGKLGYLYENSGRWLFKRLPLLEQLIERYAGDILPNQIYDELVSYLNSLRELGKSQYRVDVLKDAQYVIIRYGEDAKLPDELDVNRPAVIIFAREAGDEEVEKVLERNNIVVLRPDVTRKISEEDLKAEPKLKKYKTYWEALTDVLRYIKACEKITDDILKAEYSETLGKSEEDFELLRRKKEQYKSDYDELRGFLLPRVYHAVILKRAGKLVPIEGLTIRSDAPLGYAIEVLLQNNNYLKKGLKGRELEEIIKEYLKVNIREKKEGVEIADIWNFFLTSDKVEDIPILSFDSLINAVYDMVRSLDYAVKINGDIYWKTVYKDYGEADAIFVTNGRDVGQDTVEKLKKLIKITQTTGKKLWLVYWEHVVDEWINTLQPKKGYRILVLTPTKKVKALDELRVEYNWQEILKDSVLFYEQLKVEIEVEAPEEVLVGEEFRAVVKAYSEIYKDKVKVKVEVPMQVCTSNSEFEGELPIEKELTLRVDEAIVGYQFPVTVRAYSKDGEELGSKAVYIRIRTSAPLPPGEVKRIKEWLSKKALMKIVDENKLIAIYGVRSSSIDDLAILSMLTSKIPSKLTVTVKASGIRGAENAEIVLAVKDLPIGEASLIQGYVAELGRLGSKVESTILVEFNEGVKDLDIAEFPDSVEFDVEHEV